MVETERRIPDVLLADVQREEMRVFLAAYLAVAQSVAAAVAFAPSPPNFADNDGTLADRDGAFNMFSDAVIEEYSMHYLRGTLASPNVFMVTYSISRSLDRADHSFAPMFTACSIWAKRSGTWLKIRYQETPVVQAAR